MLFLNDEDSKGLHESIPSVIETNALLKAVEKAQVLAKDFDPCYANGLVNRFKELAQAFQNKPELAKV